MKLNIELHNNVTIESYLSVFSFGVIELLKREIIDCDTAMRLIYLPSLIKKLEANIPTLGNAIHLGTELEDVLSIIPAKYAKALEEISQLNIYSLLSTKSEEQIVDYHFD